MLSVGLRPHIYATLSFAYLHELKCCAWVYPPTYFATFWCFSIDHTFDCYKGLRPLLSVRHWYPYSIRRSSWRSCTYFFIWTQIRGYGTSKMMPPFLVLISLSALLIGQFALSSLLDFYVVRAQLMRLISSSGCMYTHFWNHSRSLPRFSAIDWMAVLFIRCYTPFTHSSSFKFI